MNKIIKFIKYAALVFVAIIVALIGLSFYLKEHRFDSQKEQCSAILAKPMPAWPNCEEEMARKPEPEGYRGGLVGLKSTFGGCGGINENSARARYDDCKQYGLPYAPDYYEK